MSNNSTRREDKVRKKAIILIIIGILATIILLTNYLSSNKDNGENINTTAKVSSKKESNKKASSSSIKFDPIEIYNAPNDEIMPQDDGTIIIEGKTAPNKKLRLNAKGFIDDETGDITGDVSGLTVSDKDGYFKFNFNEHDQSASDLINLMYILDNKGSTKVCVGDDNFSGSKYLTIVRNENIDYRAFRDKYVQQRHHAHISNSSDSSITIDAEITFE